ncbi:uncharacterized protein LOC135121014 [Zophobas morio]|uniref:uncharacterized protein LOC135121014 n=1 Tax=Zophobas morio TaxID=2755281 RepID=UPI003082B904
MDSVVEVVRKYHKKKISAEKQADLYANKIRELQEHELSEDGNFGILGIFKRQTPEQYRAHLDLLRECLEEEKKKTVEAEKEIEEYTRTALEEIRFFDDLKFKELHQIFVDYAKVQLDFYKKDLENWKNLEVAIKD